MALLKLPEKKFHETFNKLSAPTSEKLLQKIKTHLDQQYEKVTNSKKKFEKSKALMETKKTPFELLNLHVDEQAAVVVAAQKKLEELESYIRNVDFFVDIETVEKTIQLETNRILSKL